MAKLYRIVPNSGLVLLDERGKSNPAARFILDNHPAFPGQAHKLVACDPATLADGELTQEALLGRVGDIERVPEHDRAQRPARARA